MINKITKLFLASSIFACGALLFSFQSNPVVDDPYVWLEQMDSKEVQEWILKQNEMSNEYFDSHSELDGIKQRLHEIADLDSVGLPKQRDERLFYFMQKKGKGQKTLVVQEPSGAIRTLVDPNLMNSDGRVSLTRFQVSKSGKHLAFGLSESGSDQQTWHFLDLKSGERLFDKLEKVKFSLPVWSNDDQGVYYVRFMDSSNKVQGIYYHRLGTDQKDDHIIYHDPELTGCFLYHLSVVFEDRYLIICVKKGCDQNNGVYLLNLESKEIKEIFPFSVAQYDYIDECNGKLYFVTSHEVSKNKVIAVNPFSIEGIEEIIPEGKHPLNSAAMTRNSLVCSYFDDCKAMIKIFDKKGVFKHDIELPHAGTVNAATSDTESFFLSFSNFVCPATIYRHDIERESTDLFFQPELTWKLGDYLTTQVFLPSKDGTIIPMFITHMKGVEPNGETPTLMYGYGGFNIPITPSFSPLNLAWMEMGGVYASVCLRGGGEYGPEWHNTGRLHQKQNVFDDFISAGEWLIANGYTNSKHLAITGRSNGGLLAGACLVQRADLFAAVIPQVGVLDMLKFQKFTVGWTWMREYGNPDNSEDYDYLLGYSPYHNVNDGEHYPATLITTADRDDRVVPLHSFKFAAKLQESQGGDKPILLRVYSETGHGAGRSISQRVNEYSEILYFLKNELYPNKSKNWHLGNAKASVVGRP
ncbi:MAG: prolyl oligopeptidase family serine peptidase [Waddliaceae bacterium]